MCSIAQFDLVDLVRCSFVFVAAAIAIAKHVPPISDRFFAYGARAVSTVPSSAPDVGEHRARSKRASTASSFLDFLAGITVPHGYFTHFYLVSVVSSLFWAAQILRKGWVVAYLSSLTDHGRRGGAMVGVERVILGWSLMAFQGLRRLWECIVLKRPPSSPTKSRMWFGHWLLGIWFYVFVNIAIWVEGDIDTLLGNYLFPSASLVATTLRSIPLLSIFFVCSLFQHKCHAYLTSLPKYTLPMKTPLLFTQVICPHYTADCIIYLVLAVIAAPGEQAVNKTLLSAAGFVIVNLASEADVSMGWYVRRFGAKQVGGRYRMVPWLY